MGGAREALWSWEQLGTSLKPESFSYGTVSAVSRASSVLLGEKIFMERASREAAGRFLAFVPVFPRSTRRYVDGIPSQGAAMNQIIDWMQNNWYEFGSLIAQVTIAFAALWFASKILTAMRAMQQQFGALLRLSMTNGLEERSRENETVQNLSSSERPSVVPSKMFSPATERPAPPPAAPALSTTSCAAFEKPAQTEAPSLSEELSGPARASASMTPTAVETEHEPIPHEPTPYVAAPLTLPEDENNGSRIAAAGHGVVQWLQTPMTPKKKGPSPLRKVVRWLQAPVRS